MSDQSKKQLVASFTMARQISPMCEEHRIDIRTKICTEETTLGEILLWYKRCHNWPIDKVLGIEILEAD